MIQYFVWMINIDERMTIIKCKNLKLFTTTEKHNKFLVLSFFLSFTDTPIVRFIMHNLQFKMIRQPGQVTDVDCIADVDCMLIYKQILNI